MGKQTILVENQSSLAIKLRPHFNVIPSSGIPDSLVKIGHGGIDLAIITNPGLLEHTPDCKVIVYDLCHCKGLAQKAIQKGASGYVLKSEGFDTLLGQIRQILDISGQEAMYHLLENRSHCEMALLLMQNTVMLDIFEWMSKEEAAKKLRENHMTMDIDAPMLLVAVRIDGFPPSFSQHEDFRLLIHINRCIEQALSERFCLYHASFHRQDTMWILQAKDSDGATLAFCVRRLSFIQKHIMKKYGTSLSIVYDKFITFIDIHGRYQYLLAVLGQIFARGEKAIFSDADFYLNRRSMVLPREKEALLRNIEKMRIALGNHDIRAFQDSLQQLLQHDYGCDFVHKMEVYHAICGAVLEHFEDWGISADIFQRPEDFEVFQAYPGEEKLYALLMDITLTCFARCAAKAEENGDTLIAAVHNYIQKNLAGDLSLGAIAEALYMNPTYLSRRYKDQTGQNLSAEVTKRRLCLAKKMLHRSEIKIGQIAVETGFGSATYFIRLFKKIEGVTPTEWRQKR